MMMMIIIIITIITISVHKFTVSCVLENQSLGNIFPSYWISPNDRDVFWTGNPPENTRFREALLHKDITRTTLQFTGRLLRSFNKLKGINCLAVKTPSGLECFSKNTSLKQIIGDAELDNQTPNKWKRYTCISCVWLKWRCPINYCTWKPSGHYRK